MHWLESCNVSDPGELVERYAALFRQRGGRLLLGAEAEARHPGLWINCGHGHQGFTLGPASARLLADLIEGGTPYTEAAAFAPLRFGR